MPALPRDNPTPSLAQTILSRFKLFIELGARVAHHGVVGDHTNARALGRFPFLDFAVAAKAKEFGVGILRFGFFDGGDDVIGRSFRVAEVPKKAVVVARFES